MIPIFPVRSLPAIPRLPVSGLLRIRLACEPDEVLLGHRRRAAAVRLIVDVAAAVTDHLSRLRHPLAPPPFPGRHRFGWLHRPTLAALASASSRASSPSCG